MRRILITGGTVFASRAMAEYFVELGDKVYVLNRGTRAQVNGVCLIQADRHALGDALKEYEFDAVIDVCAYKGEDVATLLDALGSFGDFVLISSSAVYPETNDQPFHEEQSIGLNRIWGAYGTNKIDAERVLHERVQYAYVIRPPYLYGPGQNLYREPFVFDCALAERAFYIPRDGEMKLQFFHIHDLCRFVQILLEKHPADRVYNVGQTETVSINAFAQLCYEAAGKVYKPAHVYDHKNQRDYFPFYDYEYVLDVSRQNKLMPEQIELKDGLRESLAWYLAHQDEVKKRAYQDFIDHNLL